MATPLERVRAVLAEMDDRDPDPILTMIAPNDLRLLIALADLVIEHDVVSVAPQLRSATIDLIRKESPDATP